MSEGKGRGSKYFPKPEERERFTERQNLLFKSFKDAVTHSKATGQSSEDPNNLALVPPVAHSSGRSAQNFIRILASTLDEPYTTKSKKQRKNKNKR